MALYVDSKEQYSNLSRRQYSPTKKGVSRCGTPFLYLCSRKKTLRYAKRERQHWPAAQAAAGLRGVDSPPRKVFSSR